MLDDFSVVVICSACGSMAPFIAPDRSHPYGQYLWEQPCPRCGANKWVAHDSNRDWKTGRILS